MQQVGQFVSDAPITSLAGGMKGNDEPALVMGDSLGNVSFLRWIS